MTCIQAARELESYHIQCNMDMIYTMAQVEVLFFGLLSVLLGCIGLRLQSTCYNLEYWKSVRLVQSQ